MQYQVGRSLGKAGRSWDISCLARQLYVGGRQGLHPTHDEVEAVEVLIPPTGPASDPLESFTLQIQLYGCRLHAHEFGDRAVSQPLRAKPI